jgi:type II secretory pathway component GspD/PulD (secretin)
VTFIDVGIQLNVTPTINDDGFVTMKIKPVISSVSRSLTTPSKNTIPIVDTSEAESTVMVKDGTSIIIAGLRRDDRTDSDKRVPFLGDIPFVGRLFRNVVNTKKRTELLVLLTPHIIQGDRFVTGEPEPPAQAMKPYEDYSALKVKPAKKEEEGGWLDPVFGILKKMVLLGRD